MVERLPGKYERSVVRFPTVPYQRQKILPVAGLADETSNKGPVYQFFTLSMLKNQSRVWHLGSLLSTGFSLKPYMASFAKKDNT